jgi:leucyl-tRNA synthetase
MVPHFSEELWELTGHRQQLNAVSWPRFDAEAAREEEVTVVVQVNGKVRTKLTVAADIDDQSLKQLALDDEKIARALDGRDPKKIIVVQRKLVNIVV